LWGRFQPSIPIQYQTPRSQVDASADDSGADAVAVNRGVLGEAGPLVEVALSRDEKAMGEEGFEIE
jgi:hypothetical protein